MEFYYAARELRLTPILGCEAYLAPRGRFDRSVREEAHVTLLAADLVGYRNLIALVSKGFLEGYYYKPRIDLDLLAQHHDGLIVLSGCMSGLVAAPLLRDDYATALRTRRRIVEIFGDRFYIEVMRHGMPEQETINEGLVRIGARAERADRRDQRLALSRAERRARARRAALHRHRQDRLGYEPHEVLLRRVLPEVGRGDARALERPSGGLREHASHRRTQSTSGSPRRSSICRSIPCRRRGGSRERSDAEYLARGLRARLASSATARNASHDDPALRERLEYELDVITKMGFSSYFLIVWDFVKYARDHGIPVGPGRGSAVGSLVAYCLKITDLDPLRFNLLFERFLNPERISMPDIDTDFCVERRDEVIEYVTEKYGKDRVAQIVTFGTMAARAAIRDAGRALGVPLPDVDRIAKLVPSGPGGLSIARGASNRSPSCKAIYATQPADAQSCSTRPKRSKDWRAMRARTPPAS